MLKKISYAALILSITIFVATQNIIKVPIISDNPEFFQTIGLFSTSAYLFTLVMRIVKALLIPVAIILVLVMFDTFSSTPQGTEIMNRLSSVLSNVNIP